MLTYFGGKQRRIKHSLSLCTHITAQLPVASLTACPSTSSARGTWGRLWLTMGVRDQAAVDRWCKEEKMADPCTESCGCVGDSQDEGGIIQIIYGTQEIQTEHFETDSFCSGSLIKHRIRFWNWHRLGRHSGKLILHKMSPLTLSWRKSNAPLWKFILLGHFLFIFLKNKSPRSGDSFF